MSVRKNQPKFQVPMYMFSDWSPKQIYFYALAKHFVCTAKSIEIVPFLVDVIPFLVDEI